MTVLTKFILPFILSCSILSFSQEIQKDTLYINYSNYKNSCIHKDLEKDMKINMKKGIQFNLCGNVIFFYNNSEKSDTLCIKYLNNYKITKTEDIDKLKKSWYIKNKSAIIKKYGEIHPYFDENGRFKTFLIEIINNKQFVIYPVYWRNTMVIE